MSSLYRGAPDVLKEAVLTCLVNLAAAFTPGIKLTLVARHQSDETAYLIFSEDNIPKVIETLQMDLKKGQAQKFQGILPANKDPA